MRQIDNMTPQEIDTLSLKGMLSTTAAPRPNKAEFDEKAEHERDLRYESRVDYESTYTEQGE